MIDLPWFLVLPLVWLTVRLLLVVPLGLTAPALNQISRIPFGPAGTVANTDLGFLTLLITGAFAALAAGGYIATHVHGVERGVVIILAGTSGIFAFGGGFVFDKWLTGTVEATISRNLTVSRLPKVRGWLSDGSDQDKLRAVVVLGHMRKEPVAAEHIPALLTALKSPNSEVRYFAACAVMSIVQHYASGPPGLGDRLFPLLDDPDFRVRAPIARALVEARVADLPEVVRPLASALMSEDRSAWGLVTYFLDAPGRCTHLAFAEIFEAVAHHGEVAAKALELPFRWIEPDGIDGLEQGLNHSSPHVRRLAAHGLALLGSVPSRF